MDWWGMGAVSGAIGGVCAITIPAGTAYPSFREGFYEGARPSVEIVTRRWLGALLWVRALPGRILYPSALVIGPAVAIVATLVSSTVFGNAMIAVMFGAIFAADILAIWFGWLRIGGLPWILSGTWMAIFILLFVAGIRVSSI